MSPYNIILLFLLENFMQTLNKSKIHKSQRLNGRNNNYIIVFWRSFQCDSQFLLHIYDFNYRLLLLREIHGSYLKKYRGGYVLVSI